MAFLHFTSISSLLRSLIVSVVESMVFYFFELGTSIDPWGEKLSEDRPEEVRELY